MRRYRVAIALVLAWATCMLLASAASAAHFFGPSPYLSFADRPFTSPTGAYYYLEDFENGSLTTPGVTLSAGLVAAPSSLTDSVDDDNGPIDGSGTSGHSWYSNFAANSLSFTFNQAALGGVLPTHAGIAWTDVGVVTEGTAGIGSVTFEAFGPTNVSLGSIGPFLLGNGAVNGGTAEDRFFGVANPAGISQIIISTVNSTDWEVDHLQYAELRVPEPAAISMAILALMLSVTCVRRRVLR